MLCISSGILNKLKYSHFYKVRKFICLFIFSKFYKGTNIADVVRILVATKIESDAMDKQGHTPEYYIRQREFRNKIDVIQLLTKK